MGTHDGAVDHRIFVVGLRREEVKHLLPDPGFPPSATTAYAPCGAHRTAPASRAIECPPGSGREPRQNTRGRNETQRRRDSGQQHLLRNRLDQLVDVQQLAKLARQIDWSFLEAKLAPSTPTGQAGRRYRRG